MKQFISELRDILDRHSLNNPTIRGELDSAIRRNFSQFNVTEFVDARAYQRHGAGQVDIERYIKQKLGQLAGERLQERVRFERDPYFVEHRYTLDLWVYTGDDE